MNPQLLAKTVLALLLSVSPTFAEGKKPLKFFILSGQSSMVGMGSITTFPAIGMARETAPLLKKMVDTEGNPVVCDNVYISKAGKEDEPEKHGKLNVEYSGVKVLEPAPNTPSASPCTNSSASLSLSARPHGAAKA